VSVALVTGAGSGIGAATARMLARDGFRVWLADLRLDAAEAVAAELPDARAIALDVTDETSVRDAFAAVARETPALDALVCSAGVISFERFEDFTVEQWEHALRVNLIGAYLCLIAALPLLRSAPPPARVVNLASQAGKRPGPLNAPYNASKAALISLTRSAAQALAPGVLVNSVCPSIVDTPMWDAQREALVRLGSPPGTSYEERIATIPIERASSAEEVAEVIAFLVGKRNTYIVGEDVNVTGGSVMY
jgi:NAD(P)-dependent dehydrogenase (short-subunit alcohol dehydrogenase family)